MALLTHTESFNQSNCETTVRKAGFTKCQRAPCRKSKDARKTGGDFRKSRLSLDNVNHRKSTTNLTTNIIAATANTPEPAQAQ